MLRCCVGGVVLGVLCWRCCVGGVVLGCYIHTYLPHCSHVN